MAALSETSSASVRKAKFRASADSFDGPVESVISDDSSTSFPSKRHVKRDLYDIVADDDLNRDILQLEDEDNLSSVRVPSQDFARRLRLVDVSDEEPKLVIAIDYGTTFTGVAYATTALTRANFGDVKVIDNWGKNMDNDVKVPSVISYSPAPDGEQQWGKSLSPNAVAMINTKLDLDVQDNKIDELELMLHLLQGTSNLNFDHIKKSKGYPEYTPKGPEEIMTDYMTKIYEGVDRVVERFNVLRSKLEVNIVITVPVNWSYQAKNITLRAIRAAGFNEEMFPGLQHTIMVTEPEAAAIYTGRQLKSVMRRDFLKVNECFVLCDAGGGTVDVVSYRVKRLEPTLELEKVAKLGSSKCGSAYIDENFKTWLCKLLGEAHFRKLDPHSKGGKPSRSSESSAMRFIMSQFDPLKRKFSTKTPPNSMKIELPKAFQKINVPGKLNLGELTISNEDMKDFFDPCIDGVVELVHGQLLQIEMRKRRLRNIFLVGGFGESPFLQHELRLSLKKRHVELRPPDTSWTAVVRGAVILGIEKDLHSNLVFMKTCHRSYGIVLNEAYATMYNRRDHMRDPVTNSVFAQEQITWLVRKGDLILSDEGKTEEREFVFSFNEGGDRKFELPIYQYEDDDLPDRYRNASEEITTACTLECDLSSIPLEEFERGRNPKTKKYFYTAWLVCNMKMSGSEIEIKVLMKDRVIAAETIQDVEREGSEISWND